MKMKGNKAAEYAASWVYDANIKRNPILNLGNRK